MGIKAPSAVALVLLAAACAAPPREPREEGAMQTLEWKGQAGGPVEPGAEVAVDAGSWNALWRRLGQPPPPLDMGKYVGVAVYAGQRPTGGWTISFSEPLSRGDDIVVRYRVVKPAGFVTQAFTQPWKVRAFPRPKGRAAVEAAPE